jgi:hypothetical protein
MRLEGYVVRMEKMRYYMQVLVRTPQGKGLLGKHTEMGI